MSNLFYIFEKKTIKNSFNNCAKKSCNRGKLCQYKA